MRYFLLLLLVLSLHAEHIRWCSNYEKAHQQSLKEKKYLLVFLMQEKDTTVMKMFQTTFINQSYISKINQKFIAVIVRKNQKESYPIELLYTKKYPTLFFLTQEELFAYTPLEGYTSTKTLAKHLED